MRKAGSSCRDRRRLLVCVRCGWQWFCSLRHDPVRCPECSTDFWDRPVSQNRAPGRPRSVHPVPNNKEDSHGNQATDLAPPA